MLPTQDYLKECFDYESETGILKWNGRPMNHFETGNDWEKFNNRNVRKIIGGYKTNTGIQRVKLDGKFLMLHRVIWKMIHGTEPARLSHVDGDKLNNRIDNISITDHPATRTVVMLGDDNSYHVVVVGKVFTMGVFDNESDAVTYCNYVKKTPVGTGA